MKASKKSGAKKGKVAAPRVVGRMLAAAKTTRQIKMARRVIKVGARGRKG